MTGSGPLVGSCYGALDRRYSPPGRTSRWTPGTWSPTTRGSDQRAAAKGLVAREDGRGPRVRRTGPGEVTTRAATPTSSSSGSSRCSPSRGASGPCGGACASRGAAAVVAPCGSSSRGSLGSSAGGRPRRGPPRARGPRAARAPPAGTATAAPSPCSQAGGRPPIHLPRNMSPRAMRKNDRMMPGWSIGRTSSRPDGIPRMPKNRVSRPVRIALSEMITSASARPKRPSW